jgi:hypothetical protein
MTITSFSLLVDYSLSNSEACVTYLCSHLWSDHNFSGIKFLLLSRLTRSSSCLCIYVSLLWTFECLNQYLWNLVCTVYHGNWAHLNGILHKSLPSVCVSICISLLSLLCNSSVNTFPQQQIHATIGELLDASFSMWSVSYERRVCGSACVSLYCC